MAVVHRPKYDDWTLPKGKADEGESDEQTARREVLEETGLEVVLGSDLGVIDYVSTKGPKTVRYWAMEAVGGAFVPTAEVDALLWLPPDEAARRLSYDRDREVLARLPAPLRW